MLSSLNEQATPMTETRDQEQQQQEGVADWMNGFQIGDMVWGKVKSHPWWPGHIYNDSFAGSSVRRTRLAEGHRSHAVLVAFFGDSSYGWFDPTELIPFEPHFPQLCTQSSSKSFLTAVEEASNEISRRGALSLTCNCQSNTSFRPTDIENYLYVDVPGYEPGAIYSLDQIRSAREMFDPEKALGFVRSLALSPRDPEPRDDKLEILKWVGMMTGYRRAVFEEFDRTYAEAFGAEPERSERKQRGRFAQRAAPLSGELRVAETLGGGGGRKKIPSSKNKPTATTPNKPSSSKSAVKIASSKKNKYLLKRRDDESSQLHLHGDSTSDNDNTDTTTNQTQVSFLVDASTSVLAPLQAGDDTYVLQRRPVAAVSPSSSSPVAAAPTGEDGSEKKRKPVKKKAQKKRERKEGGEELIEKDEGPKSKKRKKKQQQQQDQAEPSTTDGGAAVMEKKMKIKKKKIQAQAGDNSDQGRYNATQLPKPDPSPATLDLTQIITDLRDLAVDPLQSKARDGYTITRYTVLNFRSRVYQKSLLNAPAGNTKTTPSSTKPKKDQATNPNKPLLKTPGSRHGVDQSKLAAKRAPSDRQEELSSKKQRKIEQIKSLASEKKAAALTGQSKVRKPQQTPRIPSPTALMMKFPPRTTLPSIASLKARFARFGQLDLTGTRVYWKSYMCKVVFKFKSDAETALNHVTSNEIFGQVKVQYYLRELDSEPGPEPGSVRVEPGSQRVEPPPPPGGKTVSFQNVGSGSFLARTGPNLPVQQPKSILKKPNEDLGSAAGVGGSGSGSRVKFMLDRTSSFSQTKTEPVFIAKTEPIRLNNNTNNDNNNNNKMDNNNNTNNSFLPPPPPLSSRLPPPPLLQNVTKPVSFPFQIPQTRSESIPVSIQGLVPVPAGRNKADVDISGPLMNLLRQCNDIVNIVKNSLGYVPYHAL